MASYPILPAVKGGQKMIAYFNEALGRELDLHCLTLKGTSESFASSYILHPIVPPGKSRYYDVRLIKIVHRLISSVGVTHLILEHPYWGWLAVALKKMTGVRLLIKSHNIEAERFRNLGKRWWFLMKTYEGWTHRHADHSFFITDQDLEWAVTHYRLNPSKCSIVTYGIDLKQPPADRIASREELCRRHSLGKNKVLLLFNGTLNYDPNSRALSSIITRISPLLKKTGLDYAILICGPNLPDTFSTLRANLHENILYVGFVDDIHLYLKGCDVFLNPVIEGGGIKTKLVEALAYGCSAVSTRSGALGVREELTGGKLRIVEDRDWPAFSSEVASIAVDRMTVVPPDFFAHYSWERIAGQAAEVIRTL